MAKCILSRELICYARSGIGSKKSWLPVRRRILHDDLGWLRQSLMRRDRNIVVMRSWHGLSPLSTVGSFFYFPFSYFESKLWIFSRSFFALYIFYFKLLIYLFYPVFPVLSILWELIVNFIQFLFFPSHFFF